MKTGLQLFTKDGRRWGNAIIKKQVGPDAFIIETDFGNTGGPLTEQEIREGWHTEIPEFGERVTDPEEWKEDRANCISKSNS